MKVFQRLFKGVNGHKKALKAEEEKPKDLVLYSHGGASKPFINMDGNGEDDESDDVIRITWSRDDGKTSFFKTLHLKRIRNLYQEHRGHFWPRAGKDRKVDNSIVELKLIPVSDVTTSSAESIVKSKEIKGDHRRRSGAASKMKELMRWASAAKCQKGTTWKVSYLPSKPTLKAPVSNEEVISSSRSNNNQISSRWDVGSCSNSSSIFSSYASSSLSSSSFSMSSSSRSLASTSSKIYQSSSKNQQASDEKAIINTAAEIIAEECVRVGSWNTDDADFLVLELRHDLEDANVRNW